MITGRRQRRLIRSTDVGVLLEIFIVCAVLTVLLVRLLDTLRGSTSIQIGPLHITHILWSGPLMLIAMIVMQSFITSAARRIGAVVGGIGFGLFIDNFGQYITNSPDYFFKPGFAIIYACFIGLYLTVRFSLLRKPLTPHECLVNAVDYAKEAAADGLDGRQ